MGDLLERLGGGLRAAAGLVLPVACAGCGAGGRSWCGTCREAARRPVDVVRGAGDRSEAPACWAATALEGPVRRAVSAHKDGGRADLRVELAALLAAALARVLAEDGPTGVALRSGGPVLVVPVPQAAAAGRRRGEDPVGGLAAAALALLGEDRAVLCRPLRHTRRVADQSRLGRSARAANLRGALVVPAASRTAVEGAVCVVVDDVVTTGATLAEAARALRAAGAAHVVAATVAATP